MHKPPGEVGLNMHGRNRYASGGVGSYIQTKLEEDLKKHCPHLLCSTEEWSTRSGTTREAGSWMVRVDLKDFFMRGDP